MASAGTLVLNQNRFNLGSGTVTLAGGTAFRTTAFEGNGAGGALTNSFFLSGGTARVDVAFGTAKDIWITGPIDGPGGFAIIGSGRAQGLTLSGAKTFAGGVTLGTPGSTENPNVSIDNAASLGTGTLRSELKGTDLTSGGLRINTDLSSGGGVTNNIDIASGARIVVNTIIATANATLSGLISGAGGGLVKTGPATLTLTATNTYSGRTTVVAGTLVVGNSLALQNSTLDNRSGITTFAGGIANFTLGGLSGSMPMGLTNAAGAAMALTAGNNGNNTTNSGALSGAGSLTKIGAGTLTLAGANTFSGATTLVSGTLRLTSIDGLGTGTDVYLTSGGGTLNLDFTGTVFVHALYINGARQLIRQYDAGNLPEFITGAGALFPLTGKSGGALLIIN
jgi:autotransporter-associated beta strand protein